MGDEEVSEELKRLREEFPYKLPDEAFYSMTVEDFKEWERKCREFEIKDREDARRWNEKREKQRLMIESINLVLAIVLLIVIVLKITI